MHRVMRSMISEKILNEACVWLCRQRRHWPNAANVWDLRRHWLEEKPRLQQALRAGTYQLGLQSRVTLADGTDKDLWQARDALVLKALTLVLGRVLRVSRHCTHLHGHGGLKATVRAAQAHLATARYVFKTDVRSYYASIDHHRLLDVLSTQITDRQILNLIGQYLIRRAERGGLIWDHRQGISLGCSLSPLLGAAFLTTLDERIAGLGVWYRRYMDDLLILAPSRRRLRQAIRLVKQGLAAVGLEPHPEKTWVGRVEQGVEFLGYRLTPSGMTLAPSTVRRGVARLHRLYEQQGRDPRRTAALGVYVSRWWRWAAGGLPDLCPCLTPLPPTIPSDP